MPNWCSNYIEITGSKTAIKKIKKDIESIENPQNSGVFEKLVGIEPTTTREDYDKGGWWNSNVNYWGTKWDVSVDDCNFVFEDTTIHMSPPTAWAPPTGFCSLLAKKFKLDIVLSYDESGCDFCGKTIIDKKGELDDECYEYIEGKYYFDNESFWYEVDSDIESYKDDIDEKTIEEFIDERYSFVSEEDKIEITKMFTDSLKETE